MDPQGDRRHHEDSWWRQLYEDDSAAVRDTGPATAPDSLDDRVDSAFRAAGRAPGPDPEPMALPAADPAALDDLIPDTELDGAGYGPLTLRAASLRGEAARHRAEPRGDALLTARFGTGQHALILVAVATAAHGHGSSYGYGGVHRAARDACHWIGGAVGRSYTRLAEDVRTGDRCALKSGLQRLTDRSYGRLRAYAGEHGMEPEQYTAALRCVLLPADPACRTRVFFGVGAGGFFRLRNGVWQDLEPPPPREDEAGGPAVGFGTEPPGDEFAAGDVRDEKPPGGTPPWPVPDDPALDAPRQGSPGPSDTRPDLPRPTLDLGGAVPGLPRAPSGQAWRPPYESAPRSWPEPFRFRACAALPGDVLLLCSSGLAAPLAEAAGFAGRLAARWAGTGPPELAAFLADVRLRAEGYGQDRTAVAVWEGTGAAEAVRPG
ncbi:protein phosphatase 2C domain-containing protein [Streptomyces sp. NPDC059788]|uniref:protein phosphatase 2C domain-containing protein n=1 Tax=Streptomyces sp. NPDC059788 TaxID=3346948 RepID=UPI003649989B